MQQRALMPKCAKSSNQELCYVCFWESMLFLFLLKMERRTFFAHNDFLSPMLQPRRLGEKSLTVIILYTIYNTFNQISMADTNLDIWSGRYPRPLSHIMLLKNYLVNIWCPTGRIFQLKKRRQGSIMEPLNLHQIQTCRLALCLIRSSICDLLTTVWLKWGQTKICKIRPKLPCESSGTFSTNLRSGGVSLTCRVPVAWRPFTHDSVFNFFGWGPRLIIQDVFLPFPSQKMNWYRQVKFNLIG